VAGQVVAPVCVVDDDLGRRLAELG